MTQPVLTDKLKEEIQGAYRAWLAARDFRARRGQREMIAAIARTLTGEAPRIAVIEAGTGTGKTAAYCLAAIPIGKVLGKSVIISSATVALQEQVVLRDLPDLKERSGLEFNFALAKGRGRYLCLKRLDDRLKYANSTDMLLFEEFSEAAAETDIEDHTAIYQSLLQAFSEKRWDGELDSLSEGIAPELWRNVTTDHRGCSNNKCGFFKQCPFFKARNALDGVDVIVANHDLLLADLNLGGGVVLPEPEESIVILDEAHHLPDKTQQHFSASARLRSAALWLESLGSVIGSMTMRFSRPQELVDLATRLADHSAQFLVELVQLTEAVQALPFEPRDDRLSVHRFKLGKVGDELSGLATRALSPAKDLNDDIDRIHALLQEVVQGVVRWERGFEAEDWLAPVGQLKSRATAIVRLLAGYAYSADEGAVHARWANRYDDDVELVSAPLEPGGLLEEVLWSRCFAAICTSATLTAVGHFDRFLERSGLIGTPGLRIPSPFDFPRIARLEVPKMKSDPRDFSAHSEEVALLLPSILKDDCSALVLFTSWRQMFAVLEQLDDELRSLLKVQGEGSKQALLEAHREDIDEGRRSVLFGLASFAEGVDLPDDYCRHVVIVKLPFAVPDDPLDQAMAEWAESRGRNAFYEISVPDTALKLVQACGRLIRHENDWGKITVLDRRIVTKSYGRDLLASLPPYHLDLAG